MTALAQARWWEDHAAHKAAEQNLWAAFALAYPPGVEVQWERGGHHQVGRLLRHGYTGTFWARNAHTGKEVKLYATDLIRPE
jgi:hypothetical protein